MGSHRTWLESGRLVDPFTNLTSDAVTQFPCATGLIKYSVVFIIIAVPIRKHKVVSRAVGGDFFTRSKSPFIGEPAIISTDSVRAALHFS